jgi:zinc protease
MAGTPARAERRAGLGRLLGLLGLLAGCGEPAPSTEPVTAPAVPPGEALEGITEAGRGGLPGGLEVFEYRLDNGLQLIVLPDDSAPVVAWQTWYRVGSSDEEEGHTGLAHLFEHLMFKATEDYEAGAFDARLAAMGGRGVNAWTWLDETVYVQQIPSAALAELASLERSRMTGLVLTREVFESEREVVINERRLRVDNDPDGRMNERLYAAAFEQHPYGWPTIGWLADLEGLELADVQAFYRRWYAPDNATIVLVGDVAPREAAALVRDVFGGLEPSGVQARPLPEEPPQRAQAREELSLEVSSDRVQVGFKIPGAGHPDLAALRVLRVALTGGRSSPLVRALEDTGLLAEVGSFIEGMQEPGLLELTAVARQGVGAPQLEAAMFAELERLKAEGFTAQDLERAVSQVKAGMLAELEGAAGKAHLLGWYGAAEGDWRRAEAALAAFDAVTLEDLQRVLRTYLVPERSTVITGLAQGERPGPFSQLPRPEVAAGPQTDVRPAAGPPPLARGETLEAQIHGASLVMAYDPAAPVLQLRAAWPAGAVAEPAPGVANLTAKMLLRGTLRRSRAAFEADVERLGATLNLEVDADYAWLNASVPADNWPAFVALLSEALASPAFDEGELKKLKAEIRNRLALIPDQDSALADRAFSRARYGADHPYGRNPLGSSAALGGISPAELEAFYRTHYVSGGAVVGLSGAFDAGARGDLEGLLAALEGPAPAIAPPPVPAPLDGRLVVLVDKPERTQAQVRLGFTGASRTDPSWPAFFLGEEALGGGRETAVLYDEVRVQRGWSYFAYGRTLHPAYDDVWQATLAPGIDYTEQAVGLTLDLVTRARAEGITAEQLETVRTANLKSAPFLSDTASKRMGLAFGRALTGYDQLATLAALPGVTLAQTNAALAGTLRPEQALVVIVGTASELEGLDALGTVEVVPASLIE